MEGYTAFDVYGAKHLALEQLPELMIDAGYEYVGAEVEVNGSVIEDEAGFRRFRLINGQEFELDGDDLPLGPRTLLASIAVHELDAIFTPIVR